MKLKLEEYGDQNVLCCPKCGFNCGHIIKAEEIKCEYGTGIRFIVDGECGHIWLIRILPWKGTIVFYPKVITSLSELWATHNNEWRRNDESDLRQYLGIDPKKPVRGIGG